MNYLTDPFTLIVIGIIAVIVALVYINRRRITAAGRALLAKPAVAESAVKSFAERAFAAAKTDAEKVAAFVPFHHPAAPVAPVADVTPPASAVALQPSAGSGGTAPVVITAADAVLAKHAQLDAVIATHQAAIVDAQNQKAAVTAAQDALNKLVA
jgi:Tfp pilus assembly protein PilX